MQIILIYTCAMYICVCNAVTDGDIRKAIDGGAASLSDVQRRLPVASCCGCCHDSAQSVVEECLRNRPHPRSA